MVAESSQKSALQTVGAIPLALVTWAAVSAVATALWFLLTNFMTVLRPEIVGFAANVAGSVVGVVAAKALSDRWLPLHSGKPVAVAIIVVCILILCLEWLVLPNPEHPVMVSAAALTSIYVGFLLFWKGEVF